MAPYQVNLPEIPPLEDDIMDHTFRQAFDIYGYFPWPNGETGHDLSTLIPRTVCPRNLDKSISDSGYNPSTRQDIEYYHHQQWSEFQGQASTGGGAGQVTSGNTEVPPHQRSEERNQTSTEGGAGRVTSGNEAPEQDLKLKLLERLNSVLEAFRECKQSPEGRRVARECARTIALSAPEDFSQVFVETYHGAKGKGEERE